jgi:CO/xanthine dehydrogenase Mo-binding subunit
VRLACRELVGRLQPFAEKLAPGSTWPQLVGSTMSMFIGLPPRVPMTAWAHGGLTPENAQLNSFGGYGYQVYGAAISEVEIDVLTGDGDAANVEAYALCMDTQPAEQPSTRCLSTSPSLLLCAVLTTSLPGDRRVLSTDILFDVGRPLNPAVDLGQIEGAFVLGLGMCLSGGRRGRGSSWCCQQP